MTYTEMVNHIAERTRLEPEAVAAVLKAFQEKTLQTVKSGSDVKLTGFGTFYALRLPERDMLGKRVRSRNAVRFRQSRRTR